MKGERCKVKGDKWKCHAMYKRRLAHVALVRHILTGRWKVKGERCKVADGSVTSRVTRRVRCVG